VRRERVFLDRESEELISYCLYQHGSNNRPEIERMRTILRRAIRYELTDRQRECVTLYYLEGLKMKDIARSLCLSKSTVSRHISSATRRLRHIAGYYRRDGE
jgi:RNA polymerase sigma factor (sigma-70 family)